jgi:type VI protein secretion system component VasF
MSTKQTEPGKDQETPPRDSPSLYTADTVQQAKASLPESFPPPSQRPSRSNRSYWSAIAAVIVVVVLIFSVFVLVLSQQGQHPTTQVMPTLNTAPATTVY